MGQTTGRSERNILRQTDSESDLPVEIDTPAWWSFLEAPGTKTFIYAHDGIGFTARRERQGRYWYAYRRCAGRLRKVYLGKTADVNRARLQLAAADFAVLSADRTDAQPDPLPADLTSFVGRKCELLELKQYLAKCRLVTLTGFGGVGKTRLATRLARELLAEFPDGVCLVDLSPLRDPDAVVPFVARTLGSTSAIMRARR